MKSAKQWTDSIDEAATWLEWLPLEQERQAAEKAVQEHMGGEA